METLKQKAPALLLAAAIALSGLGFISFVFHPALSRAQFERKQRIGEYRHSKELLLRKKDLESEWEEMKKFQAPAGRPEEVLNYWVKDLLSFSQSENLVFSRLEPQGVKESGGEKELRIALQFKGDIRKLIHSLYQWIEKDPFARLESLSIKKDEESKLLIYELVLGKGL